MLKLKKAALLITLLYLCVFSPARAQKNGWDAIKANDHKAAREQFKATLEADSTNREALYGMIFLSELEGDNLSYKKYIRTLINNHWDLHDYLLYENEYSFATEKEYKAFINRPSVPEKYKIGRKISDAMDLWEKGHEDEAVKELRKYTHDFNWSVVGPFKNISGSGFIKEFAAEKDAYNAATMYTDEDGLKVHWQECKYRNPNGFISFEYYLPVSKGDVYYANTFINNPKERLVQFRVARSSPLKIWLDGDLIFSRDNTCPWEFDDEYAELMLPAGPHRLMFKTCALNDETASRSIYDRRQVYGGDDESRYVNYDDYSDESGFSLKGLFDGSGYGGYDAGPLIRITDTSGNLIQDLNSSFSGTYTPNHYTAKYAGAAEINYYKNLIDKNPSALYPYYALETAYIQASQTDEAEEFFVNVQRKNPNIVFYKYLAARLYSENGKMEKFYEVLNNIDHDKTPIYILLYQKFREKDRKSDEDEWLAALKKLYSVSPSNLMVIMAYLRYYDDKGMTQEKKDFAKNVADKYPDYKDLMKRYMKDDDDGSDDDNYDYYSNRSASKALFSMMMGDILQGDADYRKMRRWKRHGRINKVCKTYDKWYKKQPYDFSLLYDKADYLREKKKYDEALTETRKAMNQNEYSEKLNELMGDIYKDKEMKDSAVFYYKRAKVLAGNSYRAQDIDDKMEKVQEQMQVKKLFESKKFDDVLADTAWKNKYTDEESVVLLYTRDLVLDEYNQARLFSKIMVKILKDPGVTKWTEYNFSFLGRTKAAKVIKTNGSEIIPDIMGGYAVFKDLQPGDIIEVEGMYNWHPQSELDNELTLNNFFTFDAPVYYTRFAVAVPEGKKLYYLMHNMKDNLVKTNKMGYDMYAWEYSNTPKMEREEASMDDYDQYGTIMVSTMGDWSKVVEWYSDKTYKKLDATYEVKEVLDSIIKPGMTDQDKVKAIYNYLTKDIKYSYVPFMQSGQIPKRCGLTLSSKIGDCKDVATVMVSMLRQVGIESYYTLVKTNYYDHFKYLPSQYFDHVIAGYYLDGKLHFADMTTDYYPHYVLTEADANAYALLIKKGTTELMQLPQDDLDPNKNTVNMTIDGTINTDRSVNIKVNSQFPGLAGGLIREKYARYTQDQQKNMMLEMMGKGVFQNVELKDYHFDNITEITSPLNSTCELQAAKYTDKVAGLMIFKVPYMTAIQQNQTLLSKNRFNRLNVKALCSTAPTTQKVDLHFPAGWKLIEVPENVNITSKYGTFRITYQKTKDGIHVEKYQQFNEDEVPVEEYNQFKAYYFQILEADGTRMALQRK